MKGLIPLAQRFIAGTSTRTVSARKLHEVLGVGRDFTSWIRSRIQQYGFVENQDFIVCSPKRGSKQRGGHNAKEHYVTLDMAKELAMVERSDKGREARRYFIECERQLNEKQRQETEQLKQQTQHQLIPAETLQRKRILTVIEDGEVKQHILGNNQALFDVPKLAAKIKQLEVLNNAMTQQLADLKQCYDLGWFLSEEDRR